jgi:hypothetical protein
VKSHKRVQCEILPLNFTIFLIYFYNLLIDTLCLIFLDLHKDVLGREEISIPSDWKITGRSKDN